MSKTANNTIVKILIEEKNILEKELETKIDKVRFLESIIEKYTESKKETVTLTSPIIVEPKVKRTYTKRITKDNTNNILSPRIPTSYDDRLSWPQKILFVVAKDKKATNNSISLYVTTNQTGVKKEYDYIYNKIKFFTLRMLKEGILKDVKSGRQHEFYLS